MLQMDGYPTDQEFGCALLQRVGNLTEGAEALVKQEKKGKRTDVTRSYLINTFNRLNS